MTSPLGKITWLIVIPCMLECAKWLSLPYCRLLCSQGLGVLGSLCRRVNSPRPAIQIGCKHHKSAGVQWGSIQLLKGSLKAEETPLKDSSC